MRFGHVDVVAFRHTGGTVPHEAGERKLVHSTLGTASAEGVTPTIELEGL